MLSEAKFRLFADKAGLTGKKVFLILIITLLVAGLSQSQSKPAVFDDSKIVEVNFKERTSSKPVNEICPVEGKVINNEVAQVIYNNKIIGFCCEGCDEAFLKNPNAYEDKLKLKNV